jgi:hypothetical protein
MQSAFFAPKAEAEDRFGYANAERMRTRWRARSAFKPAGGLAGVSSTQGIAAEIPQ